MGGWSNSDRDRVYWKGNVSAEDPILAKDLVTKRYYEDNSIWTRTGTVISPTTSTDTVSLTAGTSKIVTSNGAGALNVSDTTGQAGSIDFNGNTAAIGVAGNETQGGYNYKGAMIFKQKGSNPTEDGEFIFIEEGGDWRFALPKSGAGKGTYNPRSMIIAGPSVNDGNNFLGSYWGFNRLNMDTSASGAQLGVQGESQFLKKIHINESGFQPQNGTPSHINLFGNEYGFGIEAGAINYTTPIGGQHKFYDGASQAFTISGDAAHDAHSQKIQNISTPTADADAATKKYVDDNDSDTTFMTSFTANPDKMFYSDNIGDVQEFGLGTSGEVLTSNGAASAPSFQPASVPATPAWSSTLAVDNTSGGNDPTLSSGDHLLAAADNTSDIGASGAKIRKVYAYRTQSDVTASRALSWTSGAVVQTTQRYQNNTGNGIVVSGSCKCGWAGLNFNSHIACYSGASSGAMTLRMKSGTSFTASPVTPNTNALTHDPFNFYVADGDWYEIIGVTNGAGATQPTIDAWMEVSY